MIARLTGGKPESVKDREVASALSSLYATAGLNIPSATEKRLAERFNGLSNVKD